MLCPKCSKENTPEASKCVGCGAGLSLAILEVVRGQLLEKIHFLRPRSYTIGRARQNDLCFAEPSISKTHARISYESGRFRIEDLGSLHGVYVNAAKVQQVELNPGSLIQLGNVTLKFSAVAAEAITDRVSEFPWVEQQQLLLSLVQTLNSTLVLSQVMEQVVDAVMQITRAERGFLLLKEGSDGEPYESVAGLRLRVGRRRDGSPISGVKGISKSVVKKAIERGEVVATGNAVADPSLGKVDSIILMSLRTIVCVPLRSPRAEFDESGYPHALGALYVDNQESSAPFSTEGLKAAEALAHHAALAIENAQLFEREQKTIEELRVAQKQILQSEKLAAIGQMAAGIAHELNTPLTYIVGNLEILQSLDLAEPSRGQLQAIARGADRINSLAQSLLAFTRPSREELVPISPNDVIERSLEMCRYQIMKGGVRVERDLCPTLPAIRGVLSELETAFINLIVNAVQAMEGGGLLSVASRLNLDRVELSVTDSGSGIAEEIQPRVFEPFFTTKPEGRGTGLGLSTALMVVERHKGKLDFTSTPGVRTTFRITLPAS